jgi:hypothetical protein
MSTLSKKSVIWLRRMTYDTLQVELQKNQVFGPVVALSLL